MDIIKLLGGKWAKADGKKGDKSSFIAFDTSLRIMARNFMGAELTKGYYIEGREIAIFLNGRLASFNIDISSSGDTLTLTDSDGIITEYIKCSGYAPHSFYSHFSMMPTVNPLPTAAIVSSVIIIVLIILRLFFNAQY